jgi:hypothetical protein
MKVLDVNWPWTSIWPWFEGGKCLNKPSESEQFVDVRIVMPSTVVVNKERSFVVESMVGVCGAGDSEATVDENEVEQFVSLERLDAVIVCCCVVEDWIAEPSSGSNVGVSQFDSLVELVVLKKLACVLIPL